MSPEPTERTTRAPLRFWHHKENRRRYMRWLEKQLGFRRADDWYAVTLKDFQDHKGGAFLVTCHSCCISAAVMDYLPEHDWKEWLFHKTPSGFWLLRKNRHRYMRWLGELLGYHRPEDWYAVQREDFTANSGGECLKHYHGSPALAVMDLFPKHNWQEWRFRRVPSGFWHRRENRQRYLRWLIKRLGVRSLEDWMNVRTVDFANNCGGGLTWMFGSPHKLLRSCPPLLPGGGR
jgi:hypothetical protein